MLLPGEITMNKTIELLSLLLIVQVLLAAALILSSPDLSAVRPDTPLLDLGDRTVDRLTIEDAEGQKTVLWKQADGWILPDHFQFPVEKGKAETLLGELGTIRHGLPATTTSAALTRFKVSDEDFERRVTLSEGGQTLETIYLGSSPAMRYVHARTAGDETVYSIEFSAHRIPADAQSWEDKNIIAFPQERIREIQVAGLAIRRDPASMEKTESSGPMPTPPPVWMAGGLATFETLDQEGASKLGRLLAELRIARVLGREALPEYGLDKPELTLACTREGPEGKGAETVTYLFGKPASGNHLVLKTSHRPEYFKLHNYAADPLVEAAARDRLVKKVEKKEKEEDSGSEEADAQENAVEAEHPKEADSG